MSSFNMVAGEEDSRGRRDTWKAPVFDQTNVVEWRKKLKIFLMARKRNHLGLGPGPAALPHGASAAARAEHKKSMEAWLERKDTCISAIHEAIAGDSIAGEVIDQYMLTKEMLPEDDPAKEPLAGELLDRLQARFQGEEEDEILAWNNKFTSFKISPLESASAGIDRLNGICQKLDQYGYRPTDNSRLAKLKEALEIPSLSRLWVSLSLTADLTYDQVTAICRRYDQATKKERQMNAESEVNMANDDDSEVICSYPKCGKKGHTQAKCWVKKREQKIARMKRGNKNDSGRQGGGGGGSRQGGKGGDREKPFCFCCGDESHKSFECPKRATKRKSSKEEKPHKKSKNDINKYVKDDSGDESNMFSDMSCLLSEEVNMNTDDLVFLDSCASSRLFIIKDQMWLENFEHQIGSIQLTKKGSTVLTQGVGKFGDWGEIRVCHEAVKNICSGGILRSMGYGLSLLRLPKIVRLLDGKEVLTGQYSANGMPYIDMSEVLNLPDLQKDANDTVMLTEEEQVLLSDQLEEDKLELLHKRTGHVSKTKLLEAYRRMAFEGSGLQRGHLSKKSQKLAKKTLCKSCAKAKITRRSFPAQEPEALTALYFLEKVTGDVSVYLNCPSRQGYRYVFLLTDVATKYYWRFPLKNRTGPDILRCIKHWIEVELQQFPGKHRLNHYHVDGGAELLDQTVKSYLLSKFGSKITWSSTDTPELNAVSERKFRTLGEQTLAMLTDSGLPKAHWWDAYDAACDVTLMMPTRTCKGWMSPMECVPGGKVPNLSRLRRWGCKAYVLRPKADRRKDWEDKALVGYFVGYSKTKAGYKILLQDTEVTSVHVLFDESIPERHDDYFEELKQATVQVDPELKNVSDFDYLINQHHMDECLLYVNTRVVIRRGLIVGFRALVTGGKRQVEDKTPIHIADLQEMTESFAKRVAIDRRAEADDGQAQAVQSTVSVVVPPADEPDKPAEVEPPSDQLGRGTRVRVQRKVTNAAVLGSAHMLEDVDDHSAYLAAADQIWLTEEFFEKVPETHKEALSCSDHREWRRARKAERDAIIDKKVIEVVKTPKGVRPIKSKYVYKRKFDKAGALKKYKARMVALGYGQKATDGEVWNTFAPVVKGVTVRLLLALAFMFNMCIHQLDVSNAFLYADIEGDVFMDPPPDFDLPPGHCLRLLKSLYGLRTSPRSWWKTLNKFIKSLHFIPCVLEPCLYHTMYKGELVLLTIYVDDIIIACANPEYVQEIKAKFCAEYDMTDLGELEHFLNVRVTRSSKEMTMDQAVYTAKVLKTFEKFMGRTSKTRKSPLPADAMEQLAQALLEPVTDEDALAYVENFPYRSMLGAMLYLAMNTRPDIAWAVGVLARYGNNVTPAACSLMVHLLQYMRGTVDKGISFSGKQFDMHIFTDADWAGDAVTRRSTTGYVVFAAGGPLSWQSKLQPTVATSSMQSEYQSLYAGMQELVWLRGVMGELGLPLSKPTPFFLDSQSADDLATNPVYHKRSKHIEVKYHWVREHLDPDGDYKTAVLHWVSTDNQSADIYTKSLTGGTLLAHRKRNLGEDCLSSETIKARNFKKAKR